MTSQTTSAQSTIQAAGAVVWRVRGRKLEVLLVHRPKYDDWSWPKGKLDEGESIAACAVREVAEETGLHVALGQPLPTVRYRDLNGRTKTARYWAAQELGDTAQSVNGRDPVSPAGATEIDGARWVDIATARDLLTYAHDRDPLGVLVDQWQDERLRTWTMVVVRHARAKKRSAWDQGEATRPLTPAGESQARHLVPLLAAFGVEDVITSPWERCAATVRPYLEATGVGAELRPELTEDAHARSKRPVRELVDHEMTHRDVPVAVCTHRPVLPTVVEEIARRTPHRIMQQVPESDPWLKTGEMLVVHLSQRPRRRALVVALEKHRAV
ncbi:NUDIX hydrolase [Georgenia yuyongxinii]|uniref:NUDIX hydrolase n=1 Tax=Georgenia yuyongxinii TaxID=2589797 RepID=UPI001C8F4481|nr:NUDIX hydrolase [Georgenia yuyongxinii]